MGSAPVWPAPSKLDSLVNATAHWMTSQPRELRSQPPLYSVSSVAGGLGPFHACHAVKLGPCSHQTKK